jgi:CHAD domain-containing protein
MRVENKSAAIAFGPDGKTARASGSRSINLHPESVQHLAESLKKQWKRYRRELRICQKHFSAEAVHRSRVATRRLLSTVGLLAAFFPRAQFKKAQRALKCHLDVFDDLRDTQVQLVAVRKLLRTFPSASVFRTYLTKREARFSRKTRKAIKRVKTKRLGELMAAWRSEAGSRYLKHSGQPATALLLRRVNEAFTRTLKLRAQVTAQDPRTIHSTRVAFKEFRYMIETLADDLPGSDRALLEDMHRYQTVMGDIQDNEILLQVFDKFVTREKLTPDSARNLREELLRRRRKLIEKYLDSADQLHRFWSRPTTSAAPRSAITERK